MPMGPNGRGSSLRVQGGVMGGGSVTAATPAAVANAPRLSAASLVDPQNSSFWVSLYFFGALAWLFGVRVFGHRV